MFSMMFTLFNFLSDMTYIFTYFPSRFRTEKDNKYMSHSTLQFIMTLPNYGISIGKKIVC